MIRWTLCQTPFGKTFLAASPKGVVRLSWGVDDPEALVEELREDFPLWGVERDGERTSDAVRELEEYFRGRRRRFSLSTDLTGLTAFQRRVLRETERIPFARTMSYGELARRLERPDASRAVGAALARNPVPVVIPCHRVVRSDGTLGGYAAGSGYKEQLLALEARATETRAAECE